MLSNFIGKKVLKNYVKNINVQIIPRFCVNFHFFKCLKVLEGFFLI